MGKPVLPQNMSLYRPAGQAAAAFLLAKRKEVALYADAAMSGDPEGVHDLRVAVKRLREALRLFSKLLPRRLRARALELTEQCNDALGRVRDLDVLLDHLQWLEEHAPAAVEALANLRETWQEQRGLALEDLLALWRRFKDGARLHTRITKLADATTLRTTQLQRLPLESFAYLSIRARARQVAERLTALQEKDDPATLHRLRIAVKRLKYTMEPFLQALPALAEPYAVVAKVQEAAGLTHDYDVLEAAVLEHFRTSGLRRTRAARQALEVLRERRAQLYAATRQEMKTLARPQWHQALMDALD